MTDYSAATGTWQIDASHTTLGFAARHAMVAKVRGRFADFDGSFTIDGASPENSTASVTIKTTVVGKITDNKVVARSEIASIVKKTPEDDAADAVSL